MGATNKSHTVQPVEKIEANKLSYDSNVVDLVSYPDAKTSAESFNGKKLNSALYGLSTEAQEAMYKGDEEEDYSKKKTENTNKEGGDQYFRSESSEDEERKSTER